MSRRAARTAKVKDWSAITIKQMPVGELQPYAQNARTHSQSQVAQIAASIREFGFVNPVLVDEAGEIIAGHGRVLASVELGRATVPVIVRTGLTGAQKRALRLADNKLALNAGWDEALLAVEMQSLTVDDFDLSLTGFSLEEIDNLINGAVPSDSAAPSREQAGRTLAERFGVVPFTVLNAREGWWQERKRAWLALGIQSEVGRGDNLLQSLGDASRAGPSQARGPQGAPGSRGVH